MNVSLLISTILRQTTVLIAELATSGGIRAPLAHVADQVFLELARELETQGLSRKVTADMFGMALRTYQRKLQRLEEGRTEQGRTLREAIYDFIYSREVVTRREILDRFRGDEESVVRGVLNDLVENGLVFATGPSHDTSFRTATDTELSAIRASRADTGDEIVWALLFRAGPQTASTLSSLSRVSVDELTRSLDRLVTAGRIAAQETDQGIVYRTTKFLVPIGSDSGWEAAIFDHYHAVVRTICSKLRAASAKSSIDDTIGGSTYSFEIWRGHPLAGEVLGRLRRFREENSELRSRVRQYNQSHSKLTERQAVVVYGGQCVWDLDHEEPEPK